MDDAFDSRAFYAAKTASDGQKRYLFGWNPTRASNSDDKPFQWGGALITHELVQSDNGDLHVKMPEGYRRAFDTELDAAWENHKNAAQCENGWLLDGPHGYAGICTKDDLPEVCLVTADVQLENAQHLDMRLRFDPENDFSYAMMIQPAAQQMCFRYMPNPSWSHMNEYGLQCQLPVNFGDTLHLALLISHDIVTLYVNDQFALNSRMCLGKRNRLAFSLACGRANVRNIKVYTPSNL